MRVYDASSGSLLHTIGADGGRRSGPWNPESFGHVTDIDVDAQGQLWVVEFSHRPKRVAVWANAGTKPKFLREHLGNTEYGGGGVLDPWDKSRLYYRGMQFALDWETGSTRLDRLLWDGPDPAPQVPAIIDGRRYFTNRPGWSRPSMPVGIVFRMHDGIAVQAAAMGYADAFPPLKQPHIMQALGTDQLGAHYFLWCDTNGDGEVQADEVDLWPRAERDDGVAIFDRTLGTCIGEHRMTVDRYLPTGVLVYKREKLPVDGTLFRLDNGNYHRFADGRLTAAYAPSGKQLWRYVTEGAGVHALYHCGPYTRDQVVSEFYIAGHETAHAGDLGEFVVTNANIGRWYIFASDGLLAGQLFRDIRDPQRVPWRMSHVERGMLLENISAGQEHFAGWFCRTREDDRYYVVAGHNHASVVEVTGLDRFKRSNGAFDVSAEDARKVRDWAARREQQAAYERAAVVDMYRMKTLPQIDGNVYDWEGPVANIEGRARLHLGYNDKHLFVGVSARDLGPMKNTGKQWDRLFKTGAAVDLHIGTDPSASADRTDPAPGDVRLLMTFMDGKPTAVLYEPVVEGERTADPWVAQSPIARIAFDRVRRIKGVEMAVGTPEFFNGYHFEAVIPLDALGWSPQPDTRLRFDWGLLLTGPDGHVVTRRMYWSNKNTSILSDVPSEAQLQPGLWGHLLVQGERKSVLDPRDGYRG